MRLEGRAAQLVPDRFPSSDWRLPVGEQTQCACQVAAGSGQLVDMAGGRSE